MDRIYNLSDDLLIQWSNNSIGYLVVDLPDFIGFDKDFETIHPDFVATFEAARLEGGDEQGVAEIGAKTETVNALIDQSHGLYRRLRYYVQKAFATKKAIQRQFGIGRFSKVRNNQPKLMSFFDELTVTVAQYREQLLAANASEALLDSVGTMANDLRQADKEQENAKGGRPVDTAERITLFNKLYIMAAQFESAADLIWPDDEAKAARYKRPGSRGLEAEEDEG